MSGALIHLFHLIFQRTGSFFQSLPITMTATGLSSILFWMMPTRWCSLCSEAPVQSLPRTVVHTSCTEWDRSHLRSCKKLLASLFPSTMNSAVHISVRQVLHLKLPHFWLPCGPQSGGLSSARTRRSLRIFGTTGH